MGLMYAWATKEYLLWEMTIGQIILYHNKGMEIKYPNPNASGPGLLNKSAKELRAMRDEAKALAEKEKSEALKEQYRSKYGDI